MNLRRTRGGFIPTEPDYSDVECELKAMDCIAKNAECDDVRDPFRIEVRKCFLALYQRHLRTRVEFFGAQDPALRRCIVWMWVDCRTDFRPTAPEMYVFEDRLAILRCPETVEPPRG